MKEGRGTNGDAPAWRARCVAVCPRQARAKSWIRSYFACGNAIPLMIVANDASCLDDETVSYCRKAAEFSHGLFVDLRNQPLRSTAGVWRMIAERFAPFEWAWCDESAEIVGMLDECFDYARQAPGSVLSRFHFPSSIDNRHPERLMPSSDGKPSAICMSSLLFFHGEANKMICSSISSDCADEESELGRLYQDDSAWHDGFCDFSTRQWLLDDCAAEAREGRLGIKAIRHVAQKDYQDAPRAPFEEDQNSGMRDHAEEPVDAVFVIGTGSANGNEELRYALRNLACHCPFVRQVYICGECPKWVDRSIITHLQWPDRFQHAKDANIIDKLRHACEHPGIAKRILFCSDDQFQTHVCTWDDFSPRYLRRYASNDMWYEGKKRIWHTRLRKTLEREVVRRRAAGLPTEDVFYFQPHIWMPIDRDRFIDYAKWCGYDRRDDTIIASGYYNFVGEKGMPDSDHVFIGASDTKVPSLTHVAYSDSSYSAAMRILKRLFPERCRFEKAQANAFPESATRAADRQPSFDPLDPRGATRDEQTRLVRVAEAIKSTPAWGSLLGEVSRAEELRLFGVRGWRLVWNDIISRWESATRNGTDKVSVHVGRSADAARIVNMYLSSPDGMRTVRYGGIVRRREEPLSKNDRDALHARIRAMAIRT